MKDSSALKKQVKERMLQAMGQSVAATVTENVREEAFFDGKAVAFGEVIALLEEEGVA